jgi:hypothetical protein
MLGTCTRIPLREMVRAGLFGILGVLPLVVIQFGDSLVVWLFDVADFLFKLFDLGVGQLGRVEKLLPFLFRLV